MDGTLATILMFGGNFAPRNWAYCSNAIISVSNNSALFSLLGTTFGGDGRSNFALPDLRGRVPMGSASMGNGPAVQNVPLGSRLGQNSATLGLAQMPSHAHAMPSSVDINLPEQTGSATLKASSANGDVKDPTDKIPGKLFPGTTKGYSDASTATGTMAAGTATIPAQSITAAMGGNTGATGGNTPVDLMQPSSAINFVICMEGIYPSRN